jgi:hypothetical protein
MTFSPDPKPEKKPKKAPKPLKRSAIKKHFKPTGEGELHKDVLDSLSDFEAAKCFVCGINLALVTHSNMAHVLSKNKYPLFRLDPRNIVLLCHRMIADKDGFQGCHFSWDMQPRSKIIGKAEWEKMFELEAQLKEEYKKL